MTFLIFEDYFYDSAKLRLKAEYSQLSISVDVTICPYPKSCLSCSGNNLGGYHLSDVCSLEVNTVL